MNSKIKEEDLKELLSELDKRYIQSDIYYKLGNSYPNHKWSERATYEYV